MILSKEQNNRYLRHIIMPEIGEQGQKKLLDSTILIYGENVKEMMPLTLYLSAMGIGNIKCYFEDNIGYDSLFSIVMDLNNDVKINIINNDNEADFRIFLGNSNFIKKTIKTNFNEKEFIPTIISITNQWKSILKTFDNSQDLNNFINNLNSKINSECYVPFVSAVSGTICSIEIVKHSLNIGNINNDLLLYDLLKMEFNSYNYNDTEKALNNFYSVNDEKLNYKNINDKLSEAKVLIVGAGGLGSPAAMALTMAGIGTIGLMDSDSTEISNLNRQVLHAVSRIGMPKTDSAKLFLKKFNPQININTYIENLSKENAMEIIEDYDLVVSAVDNLQTRYLINEFCYFVKKPFVEAGVLRFDGTNTTIIPDIGHCYQCLYPYSNTTDMSRSEKGVLGAVPGVMGFIQAAEAYKVIAGIGTILKNKILLFDGLEMEFNVINIEKNPNCTLCGNNTIIKKLQDYTIKCSDDRK